MELDENASSFSSEDIVNFHKLADENGAVFTTKSFLVCKIRITHYILDIIFFIHFVGVDSSNISNTAV